MREAVGDRADILVGTHGQMTTSSAIRLARRLEPTRGAPIRSAAIRSSAFSEHFSEHGLLGVDRRDMIF